MKKSMKILLGILIPIVVLIIIYIILIITKVVPNPFLDTSDLVCSRENDYFDFILEEKVIIKFDNKANIKEYEVYEIFKFNSLEAANDYYELLSSDTNNLEIDEKNVIKKSVYNIEEYKEYSGKTKEEMKNIYVEKLFYICN